MNQRDLFENVASNEPGWLAIQPEPAKTTTPAIEARPLPPLDWNGIEGECVHFAKRWPNLTTHPQGYGTGQIAGKLWRAHRFAWFEIHGEIPTRLQVRHLCGNPWCVNVDHLKLGTASDNRRDALAHRTAKGGMIATDERITVYRHALFGIKQQFTAATLGVTASAVRYAARQWGRPPNDHTKLTPQQRQLITARAKTGETLLSLAREFRVDSANIRSIVRRRGVAKRPGGRQRKYRAAVNLTRALFP